MSQPSSLGALSYYLDKSNPAAWKAIRALSKAAGDDARAAGLSPELVELVCLRVSQINGCAYCLHVHTKKAIAAGVSDQRRSLLAAWKESDLYSDVEKAALRLAEAVTTLHPTEDRDFAQVFGFSFLTPQQYGAVQWLAITMNATNRISILSHHPVPAESYGGSES